MLKEVSIGWRWLEKALNDIIGEVNANKPLASASIAIEQHPNGTILRTIQQNNQNQNNTAGG